MAETALADRSFRELLDLIADTSPVPGGGSVCALNGAMAAALVEMMAGGSAKKKSLAEKAEDLTALATSARRYRDELLTLADDDMAAYGSVSAAFKLPKDTDEQKAARTAAIQAGLQRACDVPFATARASLAVLHLALAAADMGNPAAVTDAAVGALTAAAGIEGAILNIRINLAEITDRAYHTVKHEELAEIQSDLTAEAESLRELVVGIAPLEGTVA